MEETELAIGIEPADRFIDCIRQIVEGEKEWLAARSKDAEEIEAQRRSLAHEIFEGAGLVDLVGHSTPIKCYLKLGDWVLDPAAAERLASYLPGSVKVVRLIGCSTASTEESCAVAAAFTRRRLTVYGTLNKVYSPHFDQHGVKKGIAGPSLRRFVPQEPAPAAFATSSGNPPDRRRARSLIVWLGRGASAISELVHKVRHLLPLHEDPQRRISELLHSEGTAMPGLLTEPLLVFELASRSTTWTLEILFDFECARFYPRGSSAEDRDLVYKIRGFGQGGKTPLEDYLERGPRGVTLIRRHEEAGNRFPPAPPPGEKPHADTGRLPGRRFWLLFLVAATGVALALLFARLALSVSDVSGVSGAELEDPPPDAVAGVDGSGPAEPPIDAPAGGGGGGSARPPIDAPAGGGGGSARPPIDAPAGGGGGSARPPIDAPAGGGEREPPSCATLAPSAKFTGAVSNYTSPRDYDSRACRQSLSIQIDNYSPGTWGRGTGVGRS